MARAVYPHEINDPDFEWLLATYLERFPRGIQVEQPGMPFIIISLAGLPAPTPIEAMLPLVESVPPGAITAPEDQPHEDKEPY